jgi:peptidoglycan hydrolase-like protein with peptidoglycan-binding domain
VISPDEVMEMQKALTDRGLYTDAVDGVMGPRTVAALKAFQAAEGLAPTGYLDRDSRARLGVQATK